MKGEQFAGSALAAVRIARILLVFRYRTILTKNTKIQRDAADIDGCSGCTDGNFGKAWQGSPDCLTATASRGLWFPRGGSGVPIYQTAARQKLR